MTTQKSVVAIPNVREALALFVAEHTAGKSDRKRHEVEGVISLLESSMDGYAYMGLDEDDTARWKAARDASGEARLEFTEFFGPETIAPNLQEFLTYFLARKVMASDGFLRTAGTTTGKLVTWLEAKGWAKPELAADLADDARTTARDLPRAQRLARELSRWVDDNIEPAERPDVDRLTVSRILGDRIWLEGIDMDPVGPIRLPAHFVAEMAVGWAISGAVARRGRSWQLVEVWNVEPS